MNKIRDNINEFKNMTAEEQQEVQPIIDAKKAEIETKINAIKETRNGLNKKFDEDLEKYQAQKALIEKIEYMKKE
jgi:DNA repair exonuclease SbcCD ATPase subunit